MYVCTVLVLLFLWVVDPLHLELTVKSLRDSVKQQLSNQEAILIRLQAIESVVKDLNLACRKEAPFTYPTTCPTGH